MPDVKYDYVSKVAENSFLKLGSRLLWVLTLPITAYFASGSLDQLRDVGKTQQTIINKQIQLEASIKEGIIPRITYLENELISVRVELRTKTMNEFTKEDGKKQREEYVKEMDYLTSRQVKLEDEINSLRNALTQVQTILSKQRP